MLKLLGFLFLLLIAFAAYTETATVPLAPVSSQTVVSQATQMTPAASKTVRVKVATVKTPTASQPERAQWEKDFIQNNKDIAKWFDGVADGVDMFLVGKRITTERNKSSIKIDNTTTVSEGANFHNVTTLSVRPRFPNLEQYFQLKFQTYDETTDGRGVENSYLRTTQRQRNYGATLGFFRKLGDIHVAFQPRVQLDNPLNVSQSLSFESIVDYKTFQLNPKLEFFAKPDTGVGTFHALDFHFELTKIYSLTLINEAEYDEKLHKYAVNNGFAVGQAIDEKRAMTYSWIFNSLNQSRYHLESHSVAVSWNQIIYRRILDIQITPHLDFNKDRHYKGATGLIFNIGLNF